MTTAELKSLLPFLSELKVGDEYVPYFEALIEDSKTKQKLNTLLGVTDHKYEQHISAPIEEDLYILLKYALTPLSSVEFKALTDGGADKLLKLFQQNKLDSGKKLSKHIVQNFYTKEGVQRVAGYKVSRALQAVIRKYCPSLKDDDLTVVQLLQSFETLVANIFEEVNTASSTVLGIGWDYITFFNALNSPSFSSCMRINSGNIHESHTAKIPCTLYSTEHVACIYTKKGNKIIGRSIVIFSTDYISFCVRKFYGSITENQILIVVDWLRDTLGITNTSYVNTACNDLSLFITNVPYLYNDPNILEVITKSPSGFLRPVSAFAEGTSGDGDNIQFCPHCKQVKKPTRYGLFCTDCHSNNNTFCKVCNRPIGLGSTYCAGCYNILQMAGEKTCSICNTNKATFHISKEFGAICNECLSLSTCYLCNSHTTPETSINVDGTIMCHSCVKEIEAHEKCRFCGSDNIIMVSGKIMCEDCYLLLLLICALITYFYGSSTLIHGYDEKHSRTRTLEMMGHLASDALLKNIHKFITDNSKICYDFYENRPSSGSIDTIFKAIVDDPFKIYSAKGESLRDNNEYFN